MKVLLINNCHWPLGGAATVYFNTAQLLKEAGHDVVFFSFGREQNIHTDMPEYFVKRDGMLGRMRNYFSNPEAARTLDKVLNKEKPDIAHVHLFWGGLSPSILDVLKKHHVPVVHTAHDYRMVCPAYLLKDGKGNFCERCKGGKYYHCFFNRCSKGKVFESLMMTSEMYYRNRKHHPVNCLDGLIFVSDFSRKKHIEFDDRIAEAKNIVLYNCPGDVVKGSLDLRADTYSADYLFYGRLSEEKGVHTLIHAMERFPQLNLNIVGTGPLEEELIHYCEEKQLKSIRFLGYKTGRELFDLVASAKYVVVPSECYENNPMTIVEAYSLGTPVIGAAIGGISEVVKEGQTGFTFESGSEEALANALNKSCALSREQYMEQKRDAYQFGEDNFSRSKHLERLVSFYNAVING
jgi:glycosyltransferase involved in cell wall biosynthesis